VTALFRNDSIYLLLANYGSLYFPAFASNLSIAHPIKTDPIDTKAVSTPSIASTSPPNELCKPIIGCKEVRNALIAISNVNF